MISIAPSLRRIEAVTSRGRSSQFLCSHSVLGFSLFWDWSIEEDGDKCEDDMLKKKMKMKMNPSNEICQIKKVNYFLFLVLL